MTNYFSSLRCLVDGDPSSRSFKLLPTLQEIAEPKTVEDLRTLVHLSKPAWFKNLEAEDLTLWSVSRPVPGGDNDDDEVSISIDNIPEGEKKKLKATYELRSVFGDEVAQNMIHIIVQRPLPIQTPFPAQTSSLLTTAGRGLESFRPVPPNIGGIEVEITRITTEFFAPETPAATFLTQFTEGHRVLPVTTGRIRGLPRVWLRGDDKPIETRPSLLFFDLPDPTMAEISPRSNVILDLMRNSESEIATVFGVSGCGKTRGLIEALSRRWGFYFNASEKDLGSADLSTLVLRIEKYLQNDDQDANNRCARKMTYLLFFARLSILQFCLKVPDINVLTFSCARWTILQACPHVLKDPEVSGDVFDDLFQRLLKTQWTTTGEHVLVDLLEQKLDSTTELLKQHIGFWSPQSLLVVQDEAQTLGEKYPRRFKSRASDDNRPLLSPILHAFRMISGANLFQIVSGTGLSIYTLDWVVSSGAAGKQLSNGHTYMEFPGWTDQQSVEAYIAGLSRSLVDDGAGQYLESLFPQEAIGMMVEKLVGRFRPIVTCLEETIGLDMADGWKKAVVDTEENLTSFSFIETPGNLQHELRRLQSKYHDNIDHFPNLQSVEEILGLFLFQRYMFGGNELVLHPFLPELVERAFGRIKMIDGQARVVLDEPFVLKAAETYFMANDSGFVKALMSWVYRIPKAQAHGYAWELMMANVLPETFKLHPLSKWTHNPPIPSLSKVLEGHTEIVGLVEDRFERGITYNHISMEEFMDAHANNNSLRDDGVPVPPFFFPQEKPSGPDVIFFIRVRKNIIMKNTSNKNGVVPVFLQLKLRQVMSTPESREALETVSLNAVNKHAKNFYEYCPANVYISMIVAYPAKLTGLAPRPDLELETIKTRLATLRPRPSKISQGYDDLTQVVIRVDETNFEAIFPKSHVEFVKGIKTPGKRRLEGKGSSSNPKKPRP